VAVATASLVAAGADIHKVATHHQHHAQSSASAQVAPAVVRAPVAIRTVRQSAPVVHNTAAATPTHKHRHATTTGQTIGDSGSSSDPTTTEQVPATGTGGVAAPDTPDPSSTSGEPTGEQDPATDPAEQPVGAEEPAQAQASDPGAQQDPGAGATGATGP
jgi:hypothetical protein